MITFDDFKKVEIKIGEILSVEKIEKSEKLLKLSVNFNELDETGALKPRQVLSGIARYYPDPTVLVGKKYAFVTNLEPRLIMGLESQAMLMAASTEEILSPLSVDPALPPGSVVK